MQSREDNLLQLRALRDKAVQAAREAVRDTTRLTRLITILNDSGPLHERLDQSLSTLSELFMADVVVLLDPVGTGSFCPLAAIGLPETYIRTPFLHSEGSLAKHIFDTAVPVSIEKATASDETIDSQLLELGIETLVGLPVQDSDEARGVLILARCRPDPFSEADIGLLKTMAYRISRTLFEAQRGFQFEKMVEYTREINRYLDFGSVAAEAVKAFPIIIGAEASALLLHDANEALYCAAQTGLCPTCPPAITAYGKQLAASPQFDEDHVYTAPDIAPALAEFGHTPSDLPPVRAFIAIPITSKERLHGILFGFRNTAIAFNFSTSQIAVLYGKQVATALENSSLYRTMQTELAERKRLEEEKRKWEWKQQQLQKTESLQRMAGAIAHHFNNQLGVVIGNLEMGIEDTRNESERTKFMVAALKGANKAADVSSLMLTYLGQTAVKNSPLYLSELCRQYLPLLEAATPAALRLQVDLLTPGPIISTNPNQIQQILTNLVTNAREAIGESHGAIGLTVNIAASADIPTAHRFPVDWKPQDETYARLEIWDTGTGIGHENIDKIFDPFYSNKFTGRGLGLSVVLGIVKAHDGAVTVDSTIGQGSSFKVFFPAAIPEITESTAIDQTSVSPLEGMTVLLVEDEDTVCEMATSMLMYLGMVVLTAKDGVEALEIFEDHYEMIALVVSDLSMPRMDGWETLTAMRKIRKDIPVILASGFDESTVLAGNHPELPQVFLHKPFQKAALQDAILRAMAK